LELEGELDGPGTADLVEVVEAAIGTARAEAAGEAVVGRAEVGMIEEVEGDSTFSTWLTRIAMNEALMLLRQRRSNTRLLERHGHDHCAHESSISSLADKAPNPEGICARNELRAALVQAVSCLRKNLRIVVSSCWRKHCFA
jgi:RNA polymerase sigma factor (sigma-70 family)